MDRDPFGTLLAIAVLVILIYLVGALGWFVFQLFMLGVRGGQALWP